MNNRTAIMTKIILTRHGHVEGIEPERFRGRTELPLTALGKSQAEAVAARIAAGWKPAAIYTSPMGRCVETANPIAKACRVPTHVMDELNDLDFGAWRGKLHSEIKEASPELYAVWRKTPHLAHFPEGESLQDLAARTADALRLILKRHADDTIVAVGHDNVNRVWLTQLIGLPLSAFWRIVQNPCCLDEIDIVDGAVRVLRINETAHLTGLG
jgi:broad specificity phosphatase PhoE